jgi:hypothetical protein
VAPVLLLAAAVPGYVDPATCRPCHAAIFDAYAKTGMGRSFDRAASRPELAQRPVEFAHAASKSRFNVWRDGAELKMRHVETGVEARAEWVVGSGNHSVTPLHVKSNGRLAELPLSWYSEGGGHWAMSPGYDRPDHSGFRRDIADGCLFCHNSYPSESNRGVGRGIHCQRCHGPGVDHARLVNPAKLPARWRSTCACNATLRQAAAAPRTRFAATTGSPSPSGPGNRWATTRSTSSPPGAWGRTRSR